MPELTSDQYTSVIQTLSQESKQRLNEYLKENPAKIFLLVRGKDFSFSQQKFSFDDVETFLAPEFGRFRQIKSSQLFDYQRVQSFFNLLSCVHARACP